MATSFKDSIYGFTIGAVVGDVIGNLSAINNQIDKIGTIKGLDCAPDVGLKVGEHTEISTMFLSFTRNINATPVERELELSKFLDGSLGQHLSNYHPVLYSTGYVYYYCTSFDECLNIMREDGCDEFTQLWAAVVDLAIHSVARAAITKSASYRRLGLKDAVMEVFNYDAEYKRGDTCSVIRVVLREFSRCKDYVEGILNITNFSDEPHLSAPLFGQLAGAYFGLTDIPVDWIERLECKDDIASTMNRLLRSPAVAHTIKMIKKIKS